MTLNRLILSISLLALTSIGCENGDPVEPDDNDCTAGSTFQSADGCNTCTCPESGKKSEASCTEEACPPYEPCANKSCGDSCDPCAPNGDNCGGTEEAKACNMDGQCVSFGLAICDEPNTCEYNGQTYQVGDTLGDCDECSCTADGEVVCLAIECTCTYEGKSYAAGDSFPAADGCNECSCTEDLQVACTEKPCAAECMYNGQTYKVGDTFGDCDECSCTEDGQIVCLDIECACTYEGKSYAVGESFPASDLCNECSCTEEQEVTCTDDEACKDVCEYNGKTYQVGTTFGDCDECSCLEDGQVVCVDDLDCSCTYEGTSYAMGESFPAGDGCNECFCTEDLQVACTEKPCVAGCDDAALGKALDSLGAWAIKKSCSHSFATASADNHYRLAANFSAGTDTPTLGKTWSLSFDETTLPDQVSGTLEVQAGSKLSVNDCNDALDPTNQPAVTQQWNPISGSATMTVDELLGESFSGGPMTFNGSVSLDGVVIELDGSPGVICSVPNTTWSSVYLGWWPG